MKQYNCILQEYQLGEVTVQDWVRGIDWQSEEYIEPNEYNDSPSIFYDTYIDSVNGIDIYYNIAADYYFFIDSE